MKTSTRVTIFLALAFGAAHHAQSAAAPIADDHAIEIPEVTRVISRHFQQETPGGIGVLITRNGEVIHRQGYGTVKGEPLTPQSSLRLASISKQFAAMCAAMLIEEGKLDPQTKVSHYLPDLKLPVKGRELLVQDLLWHISGLPNFMNKKEKASIAEFRKQRGLESLNNQTHAEWLATMNPLREPGKLWEYTNSGYVLLARLIEVIAGEPFHQFQKRRIFDVLGMAGTTDSKRFNGSGNMATTLNDYAKWDRALWEEDKRLLSPTGWRMLFTPGKLDDGTPVGYGFGWKLNLVDGQLASVDHSGGGSPPYRLVTLSGVICPTERLSPPSHRSVPASTSILERRWFRRFTKHNKPAPWFPIPANELSGLISNKGFISNIPCAQLFSCRSFAS